ncbi:MAG TPA: tetratricopeptide repeat protein [Haliangiales bacterium]|nr:tetratricopeptide repeat protein [Haliangiales bacterium]
MLLRISWVHPDVAERVRQELIGTRGSWEDVFAGDEILAGEPPPGLEPAEWPALAAHVGRIERVKEAVARAGAQAAGERFAASPHAVERAALVAEATPADPGEEWDAVVGILGRPIDERLAYGHFLSRLIELGVARDRAATVAAFEAFVRAAAATEATDPSWNERMRAARDGLAALYVAVGKLDSAEDLYAARFGEEPADTAIAIGAARAFLKAGETARAMAWLERAVRRADRLGRAWLAARLALKLKILSERLQKN